MLKGKHEMRAGFAHVARSNEGHDTTEGARNKTLEGPASIWPYSRIGTSALHADIVLESLEWRDTASLHPPHEALMLHVFVYSYTWRKHVRGDNGGVRDGLHQR